MSRYYCGVLRPRFFWCALELKSTNSCFSLITMTSILGVWDFSLFFYTIHLFFSTVDCRDKKFGCISVHVNELRMLMNVSYCTTGSVEVYA